MYIHAYGTYMYMCHCGVYVHACGMWYIHVHCMLVCTYILHLDLQTFTLYTSLWLLFFTVYSDEDDHSYSHHEILLTAFPLALEWLDFDPEQPNQKGMYLISQLNLLA